MNEHWTDRLSEYLDGELEALEREACAAHLAECDACAATLDELRAVVTEASLLPDLPPRRDLWPGIEARLAPRGEPRRGHEPSVDTTPDAGVIPLKARRRRIALTVPQLVAAAIALVLFSAGTVWLALPADGPARATTVAASGRGEAAATPVLFATYEAAITELEAELELRRAELDPRTVRVVEENLAIIDAAIADAREALAEDPSSGFLTSHLAGAMRRKVDLLRRAAALETTEI